MNAKKLLVSLLFIGLLVTNAFADDPIRGRLNVTEEDLAPSTFPYQLRFPNASVTDNGDGTTSVAFSSSGDITSVGTCLSGACTPTLSTDTDGNYVASVADGTGIDGTASAEGATYTPVLDLTEINSATFGSGTFTTLTFDAGASDPVWTYSSGIANLSTGTLQAGGTAVLTAEVDGSITNELPIAGNLIDISGSPASTVDVDLTEAESVTWGAGAAATIVHTYNVSGTDTTMTMGSAATTFSGDLTITGDDLFMNTNTSGAVLVADGTNFNPVVMSGDASIGTTGVVTVADSSHAHSAATITEADPLALLTAGTDNVKDTHIDWGSGASQVDLADIPGGVSGANVWDFGGAVVEIPNGTSGTTDATGETYFDTNGDGGTNFSGEVIQIYTGSANKYLFPMALPLAASQDNYIMKYDATGKTVQWEAEAGGANTALSNLASVAINTTLISDADNTDDLGSAAKTWANTYSTNILVNDGSVGTSGVGVLAIANGTIPSSSPADEIQLYSQDVVQGAYSSQYPTAHSDTYVKATSKVSASYWPYFATDPALSLTGAASANAWLSDSGQYTNQRFHIDLGSAKAITKIYYENYHGTGTGTDYGVKNFTFWGSNSAGSFAELTYGTDTGWTQITGLSQSTFDQHTGSDVADPKYITFSNTTAYRYYAFKFADNYEAVPANFMGFRRVELQLQSSLSELKVRDEAGNVTTLSPHNFKNIPNEIVNKVKQESKDLAWTYHSEKEGKEITVDMFSAIKDLELITGKQYIYNNTLAQEKPPKPIRSFAEVKNNIVQRVVIIAEDENWCEKNLGGTWIETDIVGKNLAGKGSIYHPDKNNFSSPQPYPSWELDKDLKWQPPVAKPKDGLAEWDEDKKEWVK